MKKALVKLAKLLAIVGMLNPFYFIYAAQGVSTTIRGPSTVTLPNDIALHSPIVSYCQLVIPTDLETAITFLANKNTPSSKSLVALSSKTPTTLSTVTKTNREANYPVSHTMITLAPFHSSSASKTDVFFNTTSSLTSRSRQLTPTCHSALRALWTSRVDCDTSPLSQIRYHCWARAPSPKCCCENDERKEHGAPGSCAKYWPKNEQEESLCANQCDLESLNDDWCKFGDEFDNPSILCRCLVDKCGDKRAFGRGWSSRPRKRDRKGQGQNNREPGEVEDQGQNDLGRGEGASGGPHHPGFEKEAILAGADAGEQVANTTVTGPAQLEDKTATDLDTDSNQNLDLDLSLDDDNNENNNNTSLLPMTINLFPHRSTIRIGKTAPRGPDPFQLTCGTSAERALWKWRSHCDRTKLQHMNWRCWGRAPSIERCCDPPQSNDAAPPKAKVKRGIEESAREIARLKVRRDGVVEKMKRSALAPNINTDIIGPPPEEDAPPTSPPDFSKGTDMKLTPLEKWEIEQKILDEEIQHLVDENNNWSARMPVSAIRKGAPKSCKKYWPVSRQEEFMCCGWGSEDHMSFEVSARGKSGWDGEGGLETRLRIGGGAGQGMLGGEAAKGRSAREGVERGIGWCEWLDGSKGNSFDLCACVKKECGVGKDKEPKIPVLETDSQAEARRNHEGVDSPSVENVKASEEVRRKYEELLRMGGVV